MPARRSNAALLLQKVNTQLHGERVPLKSQDEDELAAYLNNLSLRTQQVRNVNVQEHEETSTSSRADTNISGNIVSHNSISPAFAAPASRFLKKKPTRDVAAFARSANTNNVASGKVDSKAVHSKGNKKDEIARTLGSHFVPSDEDGLTEFIHGLSTSELSARRPQNLVTQKQQKWRKRTSSSASQSPSPVLESRPQSPLRRSKSPFGKLSQSASQDSELVGSMVSEMQDERPSSDNSDQHYKINLMDVASLLPSSPSPPPPGHKQNEDAGFNSQTKKHKRSSVKVMSPRFNNQTQKHKGSRVKVMSPLTKLHKKHIPTPSQSSPKKIESSQSLFDALGIHMADELPSIGADNNRDVRLDISEESEIKAQSSHEHKSMLERQQSESSIITDIADEQRKASLANQNYVKASARTSKNENDTDVDEYSDSFNSDSSTKTPSMSARFTSHRSRTHSTKKEPKRIVMEETLVEVSARDGKGATRHWNTTHTDIQVSGPYGLQYVDPTPVATHVVSADALEAVTAYSPNMLALHEMMKVQLELVQSFVGIQQRIYQSCLHGLQYDCQYTTLEETREYIRRNQKPHLTLQEALQLVDQEEATTA